MKEKPVINIIETAGASGYTALCGGGKGSRNKRSFGQPAVSDTFTNVRIEVITTSREVATRMADDVALKYFEKYWGISYVDQVDVLHAHKL